MYLNKLLVLKKLQKANTHLGVRYSKNSKWSRFSAQRAQSYITGFRAKQPIIDLDKTVISLRRACNVIKLIIRSNGHLLFVNTNPKYNKIIQRIATYTKQSYINHKWIGGFLTNWNHMQNVQQQFNAATRFSKGPGNGLRLSYDNKARKHDPRRSEFLDTGSLIENNPRYKKMQKCFEGTTLGPLSTNRLDCVIIFNASQNSNAIHEAHLNQIPIISIVDSNVSNELYNLITYPIPANYDSVQFIYFFCNCILKTLWIR